MYIKSIKHLTHLVPQDFIRSPQILVQKESKTIPLIKDYLCDLFSYIYFKHLIYYNERDQKEVMIPLSSTMLRKKYGVNYMQYIQYLLDEAYIRKVRNYTKGSHSNTYKLVVWKVESIQLQEYKNSNYRLIHNINRLLLNSNNNSSIYSKQLLKSIKSNLQSVTINKNNGINYLKNLYPSQSNGKYIKNYNSILSINDRNLYLISDEHGRIHTNFTTLKKELRNQFLRIDGESIKEKDISNSQALFFLYLLSKNLNCSVDHSELLRFQKDVANGVLYDNLALGSGKTRNEMKELFFKYLFGKRNSRFKEFKIPYPTISKFIWKYKIQIGDYKLLSHELQLLEGDFIFNGICKELSKQKIKYFTVHDSVCVKASDYDLLDSIFENKLNDLKHEIRDNIQDNYS